MVYFIYFCAIFDLTTTISWNWCSYLHAPNIRITAKKLSNRSVKKPVASKSDFNAYRWLNFDIWRVSKYSFLNEEGDKFSKISELQFSWKKSLDFWLRANCSIIPFCTVIKFEEICHPTELLHPMELFDVYILEVGIFIETHNFLLQSIVRTGTTLEGGLRGL